MNKICSYCKFEVSSFAAKDKHGNYCENCFLRKITEYCNNCHEFKFLEDAMCSHNQENYLNNVSLEIEIQVGIGESENGQESQKDYQN